MSFLVPTQNTLGGAFYQPELGSRADRSECEMDPFHETLYTVVAGRFVESLMKKLRSISH